MLWIKSFHLFFLISWFAGIFYLPRLFVNLAMTESDGAFNQLNIMACKLYRFMTPFMILTIVFGAWLTYENPYVLKQTWFHLKIALVAALVIYHLICGKYQKEFANGSCNKSHTFFRWFNELPVLVLIAILLLVILKPF